MIPQRKTRAWEYWIDDYDYYYKHRQSIITNLQYTTVLYTGVKYAEFYPNHKSLRSILYHRRFEKAAIMLGSANKIVPRKSVPISSFTSSGIATSD